MLYRLQLVLIPNLNVMAKEVESLPIAQKPIPVAVTDRLISDKE